MFGCDHCITSQYDGKSFMQSANNASGTVVTEDSACLDFFVIRSEFVIIAMRNMIEHKIFVVKSYVRKGTYRMCI
jgi:hypothetical protein